MSSPALPPGFELQGHRGARGLFPENTLHGFRETARLGVHAWELDVVLTRDGVPVVVHDATLSPDIVRDQNGAWLSRADIAVSGLTRAELALYDVGRLRPGSVAAVQHPVQRPQDGARIPELEDVVRLAIETGARLDIELKTRPDRPGLTASPAATADAVLALVDRLDAAARVDLRAFDWRCLTYLAELRPELRLTWLTSAFTRANRALWWGSDLPADPVEAIGALRGTHAGRWAPEFTALAPADIARAHAAGLGVVPWTVNDPADIARLIGWGADGLCTDRPDVAREVMAENGLTLPPPVG